MITVLKNLAGLWRMFHNRIIMQENRRKILITGASGLLGNNLAYYFKDKYEVFGTYCLHPVNIQGIRTQKADIFSESQFKKIIDDFKPDIIIHCVALTNIDQCESDHELTDYINIFGTKVVVESINSEEIKLIYISSDSVYDGVSGNFSETNDVNPQNYYGISKYKGELEALKRDNSLILRTNFFGWNIQQKYSLGEWIFHELSESKEIQGFEDVFFSSIYTFDMAKILDNALEFNLTGVFNCGSQTSLSKYEFALHIAKYFGLDGSLIKPVSIDDFYLKAKRGKNLTLNVNKLKEALNHNLPLINESIESFCSDYVCGIPHKIRINATQRAECLLI